MGDPVWSLPGPEHGLTELCLSQSVRALLSCDWQTAVSLREHCHLAIKT